MVDAMTRVGIELGMKQYPKDDLVRLGARWRS